MRKTVSILFVMFLSCLCLQAQDDKNFITELPDEFKDLDTVPRPQQYKSIHMIGVQYGVNISNVSSTPTIGEQYAFTYTNFALMYTYYQALWDEMFNFGVSTGLKYGKEGYKSSYYPEFGEICDIAEFPLLSQFKIDFSRFRIIANLGPYIGWRLRTDKPGGFDKFDQRFDYGLIAGAGFGIVFKPFEIHIEGNYKWAFASMYHTNKTSDQYWMFTYPRNIMINVGLYIHLW